MYIRVNPSAGMTVKDVTVDQSASTWSPCTLEIGLNSRSFQVEVTQHPEYGQLLRPTQPYESCHFESLFGFGGHCNGFTTNKTVIIKRK